MIVDFLVDRWEDQAAQITGAMQVGFDSADPPPAGSMPESDRRRLAVEALEAQQRAVNDALSSFGRLVVPPQRRELHEAAVAALTHWRAALVDLVAVGSKDNLTTAEAEAASAVYTKALGYVGEVRQEIRRLRVGAPAE